MTSRHRPGYHKEWHAKNREHTRRYQRQRYARTPIEARRVRQLKKKYGLTKEKYDSMAAQQNFRCVACRQPPEKILVVDHDHETGEVRGLLCHCCNTALGMLKEDPLRIRALAQYAEQFYWLKH